MSVHPLPNQACRRIREHIRIRSPFSRRKCGKCPKPPGLTIVHDSRVEQRIVHQKSSPRRIQTLVLVSRHTTLHRQHNMHLFLYRRELPDTGLVEEISSSQARTAGSPARYVTHGARLGPEEDLLGKEEEQKQPNTHKPENRRGGYGRRRGRRHSESGRDRRLL